MRCNAIPHIATVRLHPPARALKHRIALFLGKYPLHDNQPLELSNALCGISGGSVMLRGSFDTLDP